LTRNHSKFNVNLEVSLWHIAKITLAVDMNREIAHLAILKVAKYGLVSNVGRNYRVTHLVQSARSARGKWLAA